jgi:uncharacterized protein (DUF362 family)
VAKDKPEELSRRDFIGLALGSVLVAGIGCTESSPDSSGAGGTQGTTGGTPGTDTTDTESGQGGTTTTTQKTGKGGASSSATSGTGDSSKGGTSSKSSSVAEGGASDGGSGTKSDSSATGGSSGKSGSSSATGGSSSKSGSSATGGSSSSTTGGSKLVCLVRNEKDPRQAALDAIAGAGGLPDLTGRTVVLKLNLLNISAPPCTTSAAVVLGVVQAVKAKNAARIIVGDASMRTSATEVMNSAATGIHAALAAEGGVEEVDFTAKGKSGVKLVTPSGAKDWPNGFNVWNVVLDDGSGEKPFIINMPCCKHHAMATWTLAMKNWIGILPYAEVGGKADTSVPNERNAAHRVLMSGLPELHLAVKEDFVVLDAMKVQLTGGPGNGAADTQASPGIVVASKDAVAVEATGLCLLREYRKRMSRVPAKDDIENLKIFNTDPTTLMGRALTLGNGWIRSRNEYTYKAVGLDADEELIMAHLDA